MINCTVIDQFNIIKDPKMTFLNEVINPRKVQQIFREYVPILQEKYQLIQIKVIRYKPQKRCLIEYHFLGEDKLILIGKIRAKGTDIKSYELQKKLWQNGFNNQALDNISVPEAIAIIPQWQMWLQKKVSGEILTNYLTSKNAINICQKVAHIAHKLHQQNIATNRIHTIKEELDILQQKLPLVIEYYPQWQTRIEKLLAKCHCFSSKIVENKLIGIHRDFYFDQIIIDENRFYLLDLDLYCRGNPCLDIGNFIAHISEYSLRKFGKIDTLKNQENALKQEFIKLKIKENQSQLSSSQLKEFQLIIEQNINIYTLLTLVRHIYLSTQFIERHHCTEILLNFCEEKLEKGKV